MKEIRVKTGRILYTVESEMALHGNQKPKQKQTFTWELFNVTLSYKTHFLGI